jgi:hypothetical protein
VKDPLEASGFNFPCHGADLSSPIIRTAMAVGDTQPLGFDLGNGANTAVHGGGSCQVSITYETDPAKVKDPASWKVIKSYVGGCPTNSHGNLPTATACDGDNFPDCVNNLSFRIPPEVKNGNAILAWTWFNNVGVREMYMTCAAVSFTGGQNQMSALPNMFVANLASINQCQTTENHNTDFPDSGKYVQKETPFNYPLKAPVGSGCGDRSSSRTAPESSSSDVPARDNLRVDSTIPAMVETVHVGISSMFNASKTQSAMPAESSPAGICQNGAVSCSTPKFFCINATTYGECTFGCATPMQMASGTNCVNGAIVFAKGVKQEGELNNLVRS